MMHLPKSDMEECQRSLIASAYNMDRVMEKLQRLQALWRKKRGEQPMLLLIHKIKNGGCQARLPEGK